MSVRRSLVGVALLATILVLATIDHSTRAVISAAEKNKDASPAAEREKPGDADAPRSPPRKERYSPLDFAAQGPAEKKIAKALKSPTEMQFVETPLQKLVDFLKDYHGIEIQLDNRALEDIGVGSDTPITRNISGISLQSALRLMLDELELTYTIRDEVLLITTQEQAECVLLTVVYDVADLVTVRDSKGELWEDYDTLSDAITGTVRPTTWEENGGVGSIIGATFATAKVLVISQTYDMHREIVDLLEKIRSVVKKNGGEQEPPRRDRKGRRVAPRGFGMGGFGRGALVGSGMKSERGDAPATDADGGGKTEQTQTEADMQGGEGMF